MAPSLFQNKLGISFSSLSLLVTPVPKQGRSRYTFLQQKKKKSIEMVPPKQEKDLESLDKH